MLYTFLFCIPRVKNSRIVEEIDVDITHDMTQEQKQKIIDTKYAQWLASKAMFWSYPSKPVNERNHNTRQPLAKSYK